MRIDIGPKGQIVGTKRVGPEGQIAGLADHAGKDVLVLVPEGRASFHFGLEDYLADWRQGAERNLKKARTGLKRIEGRLPAWSRPANARSSLEMLRPVHLQARLQKEVRRIKKDPRVRRIEKKVQELRSAPLAGAQHLLMQTLGRRSAARARRSRSTS